MLQLHFVRTVGSFTIVPGPSFGPCAMFRFERDQIYVIDTSACVARLGTREWDTGVGCSGFQLIGAGHIHFETEGGKCSRQCGPFADITGEEGRIRVHGGRLFASFLGSKRLWHAFALESDWPVMVLTALSQEPRDGPARQGLTATRPAS